MYVVHQTEEFVRWLDALADRQAQLRIGTRVQRARDGNLGDWKSVGHGVSEMRIGYGPGYRIYFTRRGKWLIILLAGGDKSSQQQDILQAVKTSRNLDLEP